MTLAFIIIVLGLPCVKLSPLKIATAFVVCAHLIMAGLLWNIFAHEPLFSIPQMDFLSSLLGSRDAVCVLLAQLLPLQILCFLRAKRTSWKILLYLGLLADVYFIFALRTRSAWVMTAVIAMGIAYPALGLRITSAIKAWIAFLLASVIIMGVIAVMPTPFKWRSAMPYQESIISFAHVSQWNSREELWSIGLAMAIEHPVHGVGSGNARVYLPEYADLASVPHSYFSDNMPGLYNDYLQAFAENGFAGGTLLLIALLFFPLREGMRALRSSEQSDESFSRYLLFVSCIALSIDAFADFPFERPGNLLAFAVCFMVARAPSLQTMPLRANISIPIRLGIIALTCIVIMQAATFTIRLAYRETDSLWYAFRLWPWDIYWNDLYAYRLSQAHNKHLHEYVSASQKNWPYRVSTKHSMALEATQDHRWEDALQLYSQIFTYKHGCISAPFTSYLDLLARYAYVLPRELTARELGTCPNISSLQWAQTQSYIAEWQDHPLVSANWRGRFEPYLIKGKAFEPLISDALLDTFPATQFYSPLPLSENRFLLDGADKLQGRKISLFLFDKGKNTLTDLTPPSEDNGNACVSKDTSRVSWKNSKQQVFGEIGQEAAITHLQTTPVLFTSCKWVDNTHLLGIQNKTGAVLWRCAVEDKITCTPTHLLDGFVDTHGFIQSSDIPLISGLRRSETFRKIYAIDRNGDNLTENAVQNINADILDKEDNLIRVGAKSYYWITGYRQPAENEIIYKAKHIGSEVYSIASGETHAKTLAQWKAGHWQTLIMSHLPLANDIPVPHEVIISGKKERYQGFYFGNLQTKKVILWWHGGPKENVSPRYNPYFHYLTRQGYGVLAMNYPGSVGRGREFEEEYSEPYLQDCLDASVDFLKQRKVGTIVSWSISAGATVQALIAAHNPGIVAMVDQSGIGQQGLRDAAMRAHIPYFSIRGMYDPGYHGSATEYIYPDGHDITHFQDFGLLMLDISAFLP